MKNQNENCLSIVPFGDVEKKGHAFRVDMGLRKGEIHIPNHHELVMLKKGHFLIRQNGRLGQLGEC